MPTRDAAASRTNSISSTTGAGKTPILVLTSTFPRWKGDTEPPFVFELCRRLAASYEIWVLAPHAQGAAVREQLDGLNVVRYRYFPERLENIAYEGGITAKLRKTPANYLILPFFILSQWLAVRRLLRQRRFGAIHAHWLIPQGLVALSSATAGTRPPILCTSHGGDLYGLKGRVLAHVKRRVLQSVSRCTVVSEKMREVARDLAGPDVQIDVVPMGADLQERFIPSSEPRIEKSILFVGRLVEKKGLPYLLHALPPLLQDHPQITLRIAGDGPDRPAMEARVRELGLEAHVTFLGRTPNEELPALYRRSQIVVFPSIVASDGDQEGMPVVPVEALGCECALVTTIVPGTGAFLRDGRNALLVPQRDASAISGKLRLLLDDPLLCRDLGREGRIAVLQEFDWSSIAARYAEILGSVAART